MRRQFKIKQDYHQRKKWEREKVRLLLIIEIVCTSTKFCIHCVTRYAAAVALVRWHFKFSIRGRRHSIIIYCNKLRWLKGSARRVSDDNFYSASLCVDKPMWGPAAGGLAGLSLTRLLTPCHKDVTIVRPKFSMAIDKATPVKSWQCIFSVAVAENRAKRFWGKYKIRVLYRKRKRKLGQTRRRRCWWFFLVWNRICVERCAFLAKTAKIYTALLHSRL